MLGTGINFFYSPRNIYTNFIGVYFFLGIKNRKNNILAVKAAVIYFVYNAVYNKLKFLANFLVACINRKFVSLSINRYTQTFFYEFKIAVIRSADTRNYVIIRNYYRIFAQKFLFSILYIFYNAC